MLLSSWCQRQLSPHYPRLGVIMDDKANNCLGRPRRRHVHCRWYPSMLTRKWPWRSSRRPQQKIHCSDETLSPQEHQAQCSKTSFQTQGTQIHRHHYFRSRNKTWSRQSSSNNTDAASREQGSTPVLHRLIVNHLLYWVHSVKQSNWSSQPWS